MSIRVLLSSLLIASIFGYGLATAQTESSSNTAEDATRMTPELLWKLGRLSETAVSENGEQIAYTVRRYELSENSGLTTLHLLNSKTKSKSQVIED